MRQILSTLFCSVVAVGCAAAQHGSSANAMGPHANCGRECTSCHMPHRSTAQNQSRNSSDTMLWGNDASGPYEGSSNFAANKEAPDRDGLMMCLSCHDGNYASKAMMKDTMYEALPGSYETYESVPTLTEKPVNDIERAISGHPVGMGAQVGCGGPLNWDCSMKDGAIVMNGSNSTKFAAHYGFFNKPYPYGNKEVVVCTTCHNPHSQNLTRVTNANSSSSYPAGTYPTRHFLRAPYGPTTPSRTSNLSAQYCRQCHADKSNEMNGSSAGTLI